MTAELVRHGLRAVEVPIEFVEREVGVSKMSQDIVTEAFVNVGRQGVAKRAGQVKGLGRRLARRRREGVWHNA